MDPDLIPKGHGSCVALAEGVNFFVQRNVLWVVLLKKGQVSAKCARVDIGDSKLQSSEQSLHHVIFWQQLDGTDSSHLTRFGEVSSLKLGVGVRFVTILACTLLDPLVLAKNKLRHCLKRTCQGNLAACNVVLVLGW